MLWSEFCGRFWCSVSTTKVTTVLAVKCFRMLCGCGDRNVRSSLAREEPCSATSCVHSQCEVAESWRTTAGDSLVPRASWVYNLRTTLSIRPLHTHDRGLISFVEECCHHQCTAQMVLQWHWGFWQLCSMGRVVWVSPSLWMAIPRSSPGSNLPLLSALTLALYLKMIPQVPFQSDCSPYEYRGKSARIISKCFSLCLRWAFSCWTPPILQGKKNKFEINTKWKPNIKD